VAEVEVGFGAVVCDVALAVFVGVEGSWIDIDIWI
jgi:hypothetical protein